MIVTMPFYLKLILFVAPELLMFYCYLFNYKQALNSSLSKKAMLLLAFSQLVLTISLSLLTNSWITSLYTLFVPFLYTYFLTRKSHALLYSDAIVIVIFLNIFHLTFGSICEAIGLFISIKANVAEFLFWSSLIEISLLLIMAFLLTKTTLGEKIRETFSAPLVKQITRFFTGALFFSWLIFEMVYISRFSNNYLSADVNQQMLVYVSFLGVTLLSISIFLAIIIYIRLSQNKLAIKEALLHQQSSYIYLLEELQQDVRTFQHDYKNVLSSLYFQIQAGDMEKVEAFMAEHVYQFNQETSLNFKHLNALNNIEIIEIKSLLITKIFELHEKNIPLNLEIIQPISDFAMSLEDTLRCLGILLDNAIEAVTGIDNPHISLLLFKEDDVLTCILKNTIDQENQLSLQAIEKTGVSTKGANRGLGLQSYQRILQKYTHVMRQTTITDSHFQQVLKIKLAV